MSYIRPINNNKHETPFSAPPGVFPPEDPSAWPVIRVFGGDSIVISTSIPVEIANPCDDAYRDNVTLRFVLAEDNYQDPIWVGTWGDGIEMDSVRKGLVHVTVPIDISRRLRKGGYVFSMSASDDLTGMCRTVVRGEIVLDYAPGSPNKDTHRMHSKDEHGKDCHGKHRGRKRYIKIIQGPAAIYEILRIKKGDKIK